MSESNMSIRERNLWVELMVDVIVGVYYYPKLFMILKAGDEALMSAAMAGLVIKTIGLAIILGIAAGIFITSSGKTEAQDERDKLFSTRALVFAHWALVVLICILIGQIAISSLIPGFAELRGIILTPLIIANLLLVVLMLSSSIKSVVQLFLYRRGY